MFQFGGFVFVGLMTPNPPVARRLTQTQVLLVSPLFFASRLQ